MTSPFILLLISLSATEILINSVETLAEIGYVLIGGVETLTEAGYVLIGVIRDAISCFLNPRTLSQFRKLYRR